MDLRVLQVDLELSGYTKGNIKQIPPSYYMLIEYQPPL
jgi:hypothetical protein